MLIPGKRLTVFSVRTTERRGTIWVRIGTAFVNKDESLNVWLDALPLDGKLHCREATADRQQMALPPEAAPEMSPEPPVGAAPQNGATSQGGYRAAAAGGGL